MINENSLLTKLKKIGLKDLEAKVYLNLLTKDYFTASEVSKVTKISRTTVYSILNSLINKGMCNEILGSINKYKAINPNQAFNCLKKDIEKQKSIISELSVNLNDIFIHRTHKDKLSKAIEVIKTSVNIKNMINKLEKKAKESIKIIVKEPFLFNFPEDFTAVKNKNQDVKYQFIFEIPKNDENFLTRIKFYHENFGEVRISKKTPMKLFIYDNFNMLLSLRDKNFDQNECLSVCIENMPLASILTTYFDDLWNNSTPYTEFIN